MKNPDTKKMKQLKKINKKLSKNPIRHYSYEDLKTKTELSIYTKLEDREIENFLFINESAQINIDMSREDNYLDILANIFNILKTHQRKYNIIIIIKDKEALRKSNLIENIPDNINLTIKMQLPNLVFEDYTKEEYLKTENTLNSLIEPIKNSNLSPFEKFLAVYNIVKQYKIYQDNNLEKDKSRDLKYILNNEYMVCVGFAKLLVELLNRLDIPATTKRITIIENLYQSSLHLRSLVKIDDDKYNIHGIYLSDPTWDNNLDNDLYVFSLFTYDQLNKLPKVEDKKSIDLLLDVHNKDDFEKNMISLNFSQYELFANFLEKHDKIKALRKTLNTIYDIIINDILKNLDKPMYNYFYEKYHKVFDDYENISLEILENTFHQMIYEYKNYIIPLSNKPINLDTIITGATEVKKIITGYNEKDLKQWYEKTSKINETLINFAFNSTDYEEPKTKTKRLIKS